ncbi:uncharacterized protein LOC122290252 isoform X3 [Carya illinoinensis]|uniref:uncharacterized protein LOC122290252 isoform X3 n=1 Tax=Carya illinoinensis TaxID=32201 RepID=UPI001C726D11|nr:uncharacterized protein LOC122290252 isoform X3 [Carya illinoinensis]
MRFVDWKFVILLCCINDRLAKIETMALVNHQMQGSYSTFISRPLLWDKGLNTKRYVNMVAKADRCFILKHDVCLSVGASCKREKLKPSRISAFKGSAQNNESAGRASGSKVPENSVKLKGSEDPVTESPKANDVPLSFISEANESIGSSPAIQKLFLKWLTMLHTQSPSQVVDGVLEEPPISELSKIQQVTQNKEREKILRAAWCYFLCLDATVKIPLLMFIPLYLAVNVVFGAEVSKELTPMWIFGPLIIALYIKMFRWLSTLYLSSFKLTVKVIKNLPTYYRVVYSYVACGKLTEDVQARVLQPVVTMKNVNYKEFSRKKLKELQERMVERYLDFVESIWPYYCWTIRFLKRANLI